MSKELEKTLQDAKTLEEVLKNVQVLIDNGKYVKAQKEMNDFLEKQVDLAKEQNKLVDARKNNMKESLNLGQKILKTNGDSKKIAIETLDPKTIDSVREKITGLLEGFENGQHIANRFFDVISGGLEVLPKMAENLNPLVFQIKSLLFHFNNIVGEEQKTVLDTIKELWDKISVDFIRGYDRNSKEGATQLFNDIKIIAEKQNKELVKLDEQKTVNQGIQAEQRTQIIKAQTQAQAETEAARLKRLGALQIKGEEAAAKKLVREAANAKFEEELRNREIKGIETVSAVQADAYTIQVGLAQQNEALTQVIADTEGKSLKTRIQQWQEYAEKVSAISQKISDVTGLATNSLSSMFGQLSANYAQELEGLNEKIAGLDEQKEAALERVAISEDARRAKEEELAQERINSEFAITHALKDKADARIAILEGELGAEDMINREFESKKAHLEKEKEKKEKAQKKAERQQKRLDMGQAIVEATGNIAQGVAKALSHGPILGPILAAVVAGAGAIQLGIMTRQLSKMEDGGLLRGKRHSAGGMRIQGSNIEVEGGEYVVNRQSTDKNLGLLHYINEQRRPLNSDDMHNFFSSPQSRFQSSGYAHLLEKGGQVPMLPVQIDISNSELLAGIQNIKIEPRVAVTDIMHIHDQMVKVDEWVGMSNL